LGSGMASLVPLELLLDFNSYKLGVSRTLAKTPPYIDPQLPGYPIGRSRTLHVMGLDPRLIIAPPIMLIARKRA